MNDTVAKALLRRTLAYKALMSRDLIADIEAFLEAFLEDPSLCKRCGHEQDNPVHLFGCNPIDKRGANDV